MTAPSEAVAKLLRDQAGWCRRLESPLYAGLLERAADDALAGGPVLHALRDEPDLRQDADGAMALRFMAAVHRLVLQGRASELAAFYPSVGGKPGSGDEAWNAFRTTVEEHARELPDSVRRPCQTNETLDRQRGEPTAAEAGGTHRHCAGMYLPLELNTPALVGGFLMVARDTGMPLRILEVGASAGLNLRWDRFFYRAEEGSWGDPASPVRLDDVYDADSAPPFEVQASVADRAGCDLDPIDATSEEGRLALRSSVWADQVRRFRILDGALEVAREVPATVDRADGGEWLPGRLAEPVEDVATVVFHSVAMYHASPEARTRILLALQEAGVRATERTPLAWLRMEGGYSYALLRPTPHDRSPYERRRSSAVRRALTSAALPGSYAPIAGKVTETFGVTPGPEAVSAWRRNLRPRGP